MDMYIPYNLAGYEYPHNIIWNIDLSHMNSPPGGAAGVTPVLLPRVLPAERGVRVADPR